ncbi:MAG: amidophosphoribosyltransferase [Clostridia bacterium]|nr:amidophosphoribosyltransferase [Clostridia bacterium]
MYGSIHEECGVFGVYGTEPSPVAMTTYYGLFALQHRGQESCGIVVNDDGVFRSYKDMGIVNDVFNSDIIESLGTGNMAVGHVRYGKSGSNNRNNAQPLVVNHIKGHLALANNGTLINFAELKREQEMNGCIFHTTSNTEIISYLVIKERLTSATIEEAVCKAMGRLEGAYAFLIMSPQKLIAARDPRGMKPLCYGLTDDGRYIVASESCALNAVGAKLIRDIEPGEILVFNGKTKTIDSIREHCNQKPQATCIFEHIYTARPDSCIDGYSVHRARENAGKFLAQQHPAQADIVIGVPDSGLDAAVGYAKESGIPYGIGLIKNKYIGRTFIAPGQQARENLVKIKLNAITEVVKDKSIVLIDDSIVRGTTSKKLVKLLRDAGAREIHMRISSPPFVDLCYYGTDISSKEKLIACQHTVEETAKIIGVDSLGYLNVDSLDKLTPEGKCKGFCKACFTGVYPTEAPKQEYDNRFDKKLSEKK